ncbi:MAG: phytanoyl-CoA dioxygenase family protein [Planctomycetes bacterium]|nr:phytanoyl-CoA dioxygenase family protein [Planctomycetota bacterium]
MTLTRDEHAAEIRTRGYTVVPGILDDQQLSASRAALDEVFTNEAAIAPERKWLTESYRVAYMLPQKHEVFRHLPLNPRLLPLMRSVLGNDCVIGSLNGLTMVPGGTTQRLHKDSVSLPGQVLYINALHALDDFTIANGCTRLVPGSQNRAFRSDRPELLNSSDDAQLAAYEHEAIAVEAPAGSLIAYDGGLWHAGSRNATQSPRRALHLLFCRPWVRPQWDFARSLSPQIIAGMTEDERSIFGVGIRQTWYDWRTDTRRLD